MKQVCMLLNGGITYDSRVKRLVSSISQNNWLDLYYIDPHPEDVNFFNGNVKLFPQTRKNSLPQRIKRHSFFCNEFDYLAQAALVSGRKYDIIYSNDLPTLNASLIVANRIQAGLIYDSHEIYTETINQFFIHGENRIKNFLYSILTRIMKVIGTAKEKSLLRNVDKFITVNKSLAAYFGRKYNFRDIDVVMNCPVEKANETKNGIDLRSFYHFKKEDVLLYYHGMLNSGRALPLLIRAMDYLEGKYKLILVGDGPLRPQLMNMVETMELADRIKFHGMIPSEILIDTAANADIGINLLEDLNLSKEYASPNKLFEYIHAGIPVLCSNTVENETVLQKFAIGESCVNEVYSIYQTILKLEKKRKSPEFEDDIYKARKEYNWQKQEEVLHRIINEL